MREYILVPTRSAASSVTTPSVDLTDIQNYSFQVKLTGSNVVGTTKLQCSLDNSEFQDITNTSNSVTASTGVIYTVSQANYNFVRLVWTYSSGTGNITVLALTKDVLVKIDSASQTSEF